MGKSTSLLNRSLKLILWNAATLTHPGTVWIRSFWLNELVQPRESIKALLVEDLIRPSSHMIILFTRYKTEDLKKVGWFQYH